MSKYSLSPVDVPKINTPNRNIQTALPVPESIDIFKRLAKSEPQSMMGMPPVIWHKAEGFHVYDPYGNKWLDWSSCVLVSNAGHGRSEIRESIREVLDRSLLSTYVFVHEQRMELCEQLTALSPDPENYRTFILTTGSEATENAIKLARTWGTTKFNPKRNVIVSV